MNYKNWERNFWADREKVRVNPRLSFRYNIQNGQTYFIYPNNKIDLLLAKLPTYSRIKAETYQHAFFLILLNDLLDPKDANSLKGILQLLSKHSRVTRLLRLGVYLRTGKYALMPRLLRQFPPTVRAVLKRKITEIRNQERAGGTAYAGHTELNRQQDGNLLLSRLPFFSRPNKKGRRALFVGGSIGLTAAQFYRTLPKSSRHRWKVINSDLFSPHEIWRGNNPRNSKKADFTPIEGITYLQAKLQHLPVQKESIDFIDACNCVGAIPDLNDRLEVSREIWSLLRVGGYLRVAGPGISIFEQMIVRKRGRGYSDWELIFINITGSTVPRVTGDMVDPKRALTFGTELTQKVKSLRKMARYTKSDAGAITLLDPIAGFMRDLYYLSPIVFLSAAVQDDLAVHFLRIWEWSGTQALISEFSNDIERNYASYFKSRKNFLMSVLTQALARR